MKQSHVFPGAQPHHSDQKVIKERQLVCKSNLTEVGSEAVTTPVSWFWPRLITGCPPGHSRVNGDVPSSAEMVKKW
jgi:hypothetical protein